MDMSILAKYLYYIITFMAVSSVTPTMYWSYKMTHNTALLQEGYR